MTTPKEPDEPTPTTPAKTPSELLDNLISVLMNPVYHTPEWLEALSKGIANPDYAIGTIGNVIQLSANSGVEEAATCKIVAAMCRTSKLNWNDERINGFVSDVYQDYRKRKENERRRSAGLPLLE